MERFNIVSTIGAKYHVGNIENGEFSYAKALKTVGKDIKDYQKATEGTKHQNLDLRFANERLAILIETKNRFSKWNQDEMYAQLQAYVRFEKEYSDKRIVAILAETEGNGIRVWHGQSVIIDDEHLDEGEHSLRPFNEYEDMCFGKVNDKIAVVDSINALNKMLHADGVNERLRSQFVGTCLLALKNGLSYKDAKETLGKDGQTLTKTRVVLRNITDILTGLLERTFTEADDSESKMNKADKLSLLNRKVLETQDIQNLQYEDLKEVLEYIEFNVVPYINDKNTAGQDLLNLFFTTFNKYVGKSDKNQAFTPDHICDFMSKVVGVNKNSRVLDPCCGSGAFLVRAMTDAMDDCDTDEERRQVREHQIYGIEYEEGAFGLSSTNMLIHGDGNSNVVKDSMFDRAAWIQSKSIDVVLMNPPYNGTKNQCEPKYVRQWSDNTKTDPSKGFHYVEWVARQIASAKDENGHVRPSHCRMAVLLPMQCAIGNSTAVRDFKQQMLDHYTLDAVFSLPADVFYPGAAVSACCMVFDLSRKHEKTDRSTFFGYFKDDGFIKRKGVGRVETTDANGNSNWEHIEREWLALYRERTSKPGLSVTHKVTYEDEWLAEAYMDTDYGKLTRADFQKTVNDYLAYLVQEGKVYES